MENLYDVIIIGGGPAGLSSAIYMARAKYKVLVLEKEKIGGQITITSEVVNYPGVFKTSGTELTSNMQQQAESFGAEFKIDDVVDIQLDGDIKTVVTKTTEYKALGVILALGANPRKLGFEGEKEYQGRGVAYCATCDGEFFKDMEVFVIGGGFAAVEEGIFLTKYASRVHMVVREEDFTCAKTVSDHIYENDKIDIQFNTEVVNVKGDGTLKSITLKNNITSVETTHKLEDGFGVFVFAGYVPNTGWLLETIEKDRGYIVTDENQATNIEGVYAAGDVCIKNLRQVVTAVSDGATAATSLEKYVESIHQKLDIPDLVQAPTKTVHQTSHVESDETGFISEEIKVQLQPIFERFEHTVYVKAYIAKGQLADEISGFVDECSTLHNKIVCSKEVASDDISYIELFDKDQISSGLKFRAVPGGHEFNSFIIALYNVAGPGKEVASEILTKIKKIDKETDIKVLISLSCTMCPEVVVGAGQIAAHSPHVTTTMIDLQHAPELKEKYKIMSVPCMVINDEIVSFGKKGIEEILEIIE